MSIKTKEKFIRSTSYGLMIFYGLCMLAAAVFVSVDPSGSINETLKPATHPNSERSYLDRLEFKSLFFIVDFVSLELIILAARGLTTNYDWRDSAASLGIYLINLFIAPLVLIISYTALRFLEPYALFELQHGPLTFFIIFVVAEGAYYWFHRCCHEIPFMWSVHHAHHSATSLNLSIAFRLHSFGRLMIVVFYIPLVLMGFKLDHLMMSLGLSLLYQFFVHTQSVNKLGWLEHIGFNTPFKHRAHHGSNTYCIDKNYSGILMFWDYIHKTHTTERDFEAIHYGVATSHNSHNPLTITYRPQWEWLKGKLKREAEQSNF